MSEHDFEGNESAEVNEYDVFRAKYNGQTIPELVTQMARVAESLEAAKAASSLLNREFDFLRLALIPERCESEGVEGMKVEGIGRLSLTGDMYVSVKSGQQDRAQEWLRDIGKGDVIKEQISSSQLKAIVKKMMQDGVTIPDGLLNVTPFTRASITKK